MPITVKHEPAARAIAGAAYTGGLGGYQRWRAQMQLQYDQLAQQDAAQQRALAANQQAQQAAHAQQNRQGLQQFVLDQFGRQQGIARQDELLGQQRQQQLADLQQQRVWEQEDMQARQQNDLDLLQERERLQAEQARQQQEMERAAQIEAELEAGDRAFTPLQQARLNDIDAQMEAVQNFKGLNEDERAQSIGKLEEQRKKIVPSRVDPASKAPTVDQLEGKSFQVEEREDGSRVVKRITRNGDVQVTTVEADASHPFQIRKNIADRVADAVTKWIGESTVDVNTGERKPISPDEIADRTAKLQAALERQYDLQGAEKKFKEKNSQKPPANPQDGLGQRPGTPMSPAAAPPAAPMNPQATPANARNLPPPPPAPPPLPIDPEAVAADLADFAMNMTGKNWGSWNSTKWNEQNAVAQRNLDEKLQKIPRADVEQMLSAVQKLNEGGQRKVFMEGYLQSHLNNRPAKGYDVPYGDRNARPVPSFDSKSPQNLNTWVAKQKPGSVFMLDGKVKMVLQDNPDGRKAIGTLSEADYRRLTE